MFPLRWLLLSLLALVGTVYSQGTFGSKRGGVENITSEKYTVLRLTEFPNHSVRVKSSRFCDGTVNAYTGYIDIDARHLFFYFFESRRDPAADDVIFWTNGGPGGSSALGLFMELGPCRVTDSQNTTFNAYSWNKYANVFFIDQPVGTGFSYAEHGEHVDDGFEAAKDIVAFVTIFFEHFDQFKGRPFHMAGESYAGHLLPIYAGEIYDHNTKLVASGLAPINLTSIMLGDGCTTGTTMYQAYFDMMCTPVSVPPVLSVGACVGIKRGLSRCIEWHKQSCVDTFDHINCQAAMHFCSNLIAVPFAQAMRSPHDLTLPCDDPTGGTCYPIWSDIEAYLSNTTLQKELGVDPAVPANFSLTNGSISDRFARNLDSVFPSQYYTSALLNRGIRVLIFVGANDWVCNWLGNEDMTLKLEWPGSKQFAQKPLKEWTIDGRAVGLTRSEGNLAFVTVYGAGHMAPYDKPEETLELARRWLSDEKF